MRIRTAEEHQAIAEKHIKQQEELRKTQPLAIGVYVDRRGFTIIPRKSLAVGIDELKAELEKQGL